MAGMTGMPLGSMLPPHAMPAGLGHFQQGHFQQGHGMMPTGMTLQQEMEEFMEFRTYQQQRQMRDRARQKRKEGAERYEGFCSTGQTHCSAALIRLFSVRGGGGLETSIGNREDVGYTQTKTYT